ncbi:hypothetical protein O3G_MSEX010160 [Manduca sexta]|uniref:Transglutaminase-like domain-containing protein n=2 Tax=Manduca sexta TaxID=7130 RepID=A0A922CTD8_MANSE|nr:hypothetical protein O3G_MSEX010160 [Manduca sexta]
MVRFNRPYDETKDLVQLVFSLGKRVHMETQGTMYIRPDAVQDKHTWTAKLTASKENTLSFEVTTPVTVPVGNWALQVVTRLKSTSQRMVYKYEQDLYILFNPWNQDDQTYMEDSKLLKEYVLQDVGKVWQGRFSKPWAFGQFDDVVLPACMYMLERANMPFHHRGDPIKMSRIISRIVNVNDDGGVVIGRWYGEYKDGTAPWDWTGSVDILSQYLKTKRSVAYGQCWVFACVLNTVCRALGLPSRVVTNLSSAHDGDKSLSIDNYFSEDMKELPDMSPDSIWNYHVWNDVWMARPDLPAGFGGWQAVDATPQELSQGMHQCGPAPVIAVKKGEIGFNYDVDFLLSTVNADVLHWRKDDNAELGYSVVGSDKYKVGRQILTKKPFVFDPYGDKDVEDITHQYKYKEGTNSERIALMNGVRQSEKARRYYDVLKTMNNDVKFSLRDIETVTIGNDFSVAVDIENTSDKGHNVKASLSAISVYYNGVRANVVKEVEQNIFVGPHKKETMSVSVTYGEYLPKLVEHCNMKISAMAMVEATKQAWADADDFQILKPKIDFKVNNKLVLNQPSPVVLSFKNPLDRPLTGCEFRLTSSGVVGRTMHLPAANVEAHGMVHAELKLMPKKLGKVEFVATFKSVQLTDVHGAASVEVLPK